MIKLIFITILIVLDIIAFQTQIKANTKHNYSDNLMYLVNQIRLDNGCGFNLFENTDLDKAAKIRSEQSINNWTHKGWEKIVYKYYHYRMAGENLAKDFKKDQDVINAWLKSPKHKEVMINCSYREIGIGRTGSNIALELGRK